MVPSESMVTKSARRTNRRNGFVTPANTAPYISTIVSIWTDGDETVGSLSGNYYTFTGRRSDPESELIYFRNRYYSAELGRFVTRDNGHLDGMNLYAAYFVCYGTTDMFGLAADEISKEDCEKQLNQFWVLNPKLADEVESWELGKQGRKPCLLKIDCVCCENPEKGGEFIPAKRKQRKDDPGGAVTTSRPRGGQIEVCYGEKRALYGPLSPASDLAHELRHWLDSCQEKHIFDCATWVCGEMRAYFAEGKCTSLRNCRKYMIEHFFTDAGKKATATTPFCAGKGWVDIEEDPAYRFCGVERLPGGKPTYPEDPEAEQ